MATLQEQARALGDPTRHSIFQYVVDATEPVTVAELTGHLGLNHNAIRQHLAKLVAAEMITESTAPAEGPGRPRLLYVVDPGVEGQWGLPGPYQRLSDLLSEVISTGDTPLEVGRRAGRREQSDAADTDDTIGALERTIARDGFAPDVRSRGSNVEVVLHRCPFESSATAHPEVVCELHRGLAEGLVESNDAVVVDELVVKDPRRANCRLLLRVDEAV